MDSSSLRLRSLLDRGDSGFYLIVLQGIRPFLPKTSSRMNLDKLKEIARRHELREEWRKAIDTYRTAAARLDQAGEAQDPSLFNRVGDLELKAGNQSAAVTAYERAAHIYADQGFLNNAIALCGKILRVEPRRTEVYLHLAELHAEKNVVAEAVRNATEYYRRMQGEDRDDEGVATLRRYAARFAGSAELRTAVTLLLGEANREREEPGDESDDSSSAPFQTGERSSPQIMNPARTVASSNGLVFLDTRAGPIAGSSDAGASVLTPPEDVDVPRVSGFEPTLLDPGLDPPEDFTLTLEAPVIELLEIDDVGSTSDPAAPSFGEPLDAVEDAPVMSPDPTEREIAMLEARLGAFEAEGRWTEAYAVAVELTRLEPDRVFRHQKKVEVAYQTGQRNLLVSSYLGLADALKHLGARTNAAVVYQKVLEHDPGNASALAALEETAPGPRPVADPSPATDFVDLGALILENEPSRDTRMRVEQGEPVGDEDQDFLATLAQFKEGLAANVDATDFQTHYDLGIAFKEMGLLDEAVAQFQKALKAPGGHLRSAEALGTIFFEKKQYGVAEAVLKRAIETLADAEGEKIGLLYWIGRAVEAQGRSDQAVRWYERAMAVDITFSDVNERLRRLMETSGS